MKKGKRLLTVLLALALIIGCVPFAAFAAEDEIEGGAKAVASIKYNSKTWKPDKDFVISVEVAHNVKTITLSDDVTVQRLSQSDGFIPGGYRFVNAKGAEVDKVTIGSNDTGSVILRQTYKKEKGGDTYYTDYTVEFERLPEQAPTFEGSIEITLDVDDDARAFKETEFTKLYKKNDGGDLKYIAIIDETPDVAVLKLGSKTYNTGDKIELSKISTLKLEPKGEGSTFFTVEAYDSTYSSTKNPDPLDGSVTIDVTVKKSSKISKLTGSVSGGGSLNLSSLGIPAAFKKVAKADLDSIVFSELPEYGDIYNGSSTKLTSRKASLTASELAKCKYKADAVSGNKKLTDTIKYLAYDKDDNEYSGTIEITVKNQKMDLDDITANIKLNGTLKLSSLNLATKFKADCGETLDSVYFTEPSDGTLRYNYTSSTKTGEAVDEDELYYAGTSTKKLTIGNVTYIPDKNFTGTDYIYYLAYDLKDNEYEGRIKVNVANNSAGEAGSYSIDSDEVLYFSEVVDDINDIFYDMSDVKNFSYVTFTQPATREGSIRYGYESPTKLGTKVGSSDKFYKSGSSKLVSDLVFVPDEDFDGECEIEFTVYGTSKDDEYEGTLTVKVSESDYELGTLTYNVESGKVFAFDDVASDINKKFKDEADGNFKYLTFEEVPAKAKGTLYYDYDSKKGSGTKVEEDDDEFYRNDRTELRVSDLVLVPAKGFSGQIPLKYWAYGDGNSLGGKMIINVKAQTAEFEALEYKIYNNQILKLSSSDIAAKLKKVSDGTLDYITLSPVSSNAGNMYYSYVSGSDNGGEFTGRDDLYRTGSRNKLIDDVTYVPLINYIGSFDLGFTAYDDDDNSFDGKIKITVSEPDPFKDTKMSDWFYNAAKWGAGREIAKGTSTDPKNPQFSPNWDCTWAQILTFIWRANGSPKATINNPYTDLKSGDYCYDAILWAVSKGIASPKSSTEFGVNTPCTRGQALNFIYKAKNSPSVRGLSNNFNDVSANDDFYNAVLWGVDQGITNGTSATTFAPNTICTRGHIITFLYRAIERKDLQNGKTQ